MAEDGEKAGEAEAGEGEVEEGQQRRPLAGQRQQAQLSEPLIRRWQELPPVLAEMEGPAGSGETPAAASSPPSPKQQCGRMQHDAEGQKGVRQPAAARA